MEIGKPIQIVKVNENGGKSSLELDEEALASIIMNPKLKNTPVCVISVAGAFRKGKSFLLDFFLRYMNSNKDKNWLGDKSKPLTGFHWRGGAERDTFGILMWSVPFIVSLPSKEEVAVIFIDTQGSFDSKSTVKQCATIFALSTMISSKQVYNIQSNLQEDNLQHLQFFTEYGRIAMETGQRQTPFQHLEFLIRDWSYPYEFPFGSVGGMELLNRRFEILPDMHPEHASLRLHITSCFSNLTCFLMPHPGLKVATNPNFDGRVEDIDPEFVDQLSDFVSSILAPKNLFVKSINGQTVSCHELMLYIKAYVAIYQGDTLPEPMSALQATSEVNNLSTLVRCKEFYINEMNKVCGPTRSYISDRTIEVTHQACLKQAMTIFKETPKMGAESLSEAFENRLLNELNKLIDDYKQSNNNKNTLNHVKTPGILLIMVFIFYILTGFLDMIGLSTASNFLLVPFWLFSVALITWLFTRFSGQVPVIGEAIDDGAQTVADWIINPTVEHIGQRAVARTIGLSSTN